MEYLRRAHREFLDGTGNSDAGSVLWCALNIEHWLEAAQSRSHTEAAGRDD
jgi:hypothetical protein